MQRSVTKRILEVSKYSFFAVLFSILLSGCTIIPSKKKTAEDPEAKKIVMWSFEEEDVWKPIKKKFEANNKGYTLVYQKQIFDDSYENRVLNSILSSQKPDVWAMPNDWVYRHKDKLAPLSETATKNLNFDKNYVDAIGQSVLFDKKAYALSPSAEPLVVYYNPEIVNSRLKELREEYKDDKEERDRINSLLKDIPTTWTDFTEAANLLTTKAGDSISVSGLAMGTNKISLSSDILYLLMLQNETDILSLDTNLAIYNLPKSTSKGTNDNPGQRALEFYASFADPDSDNYTWNDSLGSEVDAFAQGKAAMIFGYSSLQNYLTQKYPDFKYRKAFAPQVSQDATKIADYARFTAFGISKLSKNTSISWQAVFSLIENASSFNSATHLYTSKKASDYNISIENRAGNNPEKLSLATAKSLPKGRYPRDFDNYLKTAIEAVNKGSQTPKAALDLAANNATENLRKTDW